MSIVFLCRLLIIFGLFFLSVGYSGTWTMTVANGASDYVISFKNPGYSGALCGASINKKHINQNQTASLIVQGEACSPSYGSTVIGSLPLEVKKINSNVVLARCTLYIPFSNVCVPGDPPQLNNIKLIKCTNINLKGKIFLSVKNMTNCGIYSD